MYFLFMFYLDGVDFEIFNVYVFNFGDNYKIGFVVNGVLLILILYIISFFCLLNFYNVLYKLCVFFGS